MNFIDASTLGFEALNRLSASASSTVTPFVIGTSEDDAEFEDESIEDSETPLWLMGNTFSAIYDKDQIRQSTQSRLWITYRKDFPAIANSGLTSDRGWGCMLRCGQMVVAECFIRLKLGPSWTWSADSSWIDDATYRDIVRLFADDDAAPFSLHRIAVIGSHGPSGKPIGTWFGPNTVAQAIKRLTRSYRAEVVYDDIKVEIALDNLIAIDELKEVSKGRTGRWSPLCLFVPLRLGLMEMNPLYAPDIKECFEIPSCCGIIGGRPNHALYFIGCIDDKLIYLDPHTTQPAVDLQSSTSSDRSYHTSRHRTISIYRIDPSLALCFFCPTEASFDDLCTDLNCRLVRGHTAPMLNVCRQRPDICETPSRSVDTTTADDADEADFELL